MTEGSNKSLVIVGAGETALLAYEYFTHDSEYEVVAFSVNEAFITETEINGLPVVALEQVQSQFSPSEVEAFVAFGSGRLNRDRMKMYQLMKDKGYVLASYISSKAFVWRGVEIGENCFILEDNTLQPFVKVGNNVTLWSGNHLGHRTSVADHCFISSHCVISGYCEIKSACFLGVNCTVENNVTIEKDCFIGARSLIQKSTVEKGVYQEKQTELARVNSHRLFKVKE